MKMESALEKAFSDQITMEFDASLVYRQLAIEMDMLSLPGMASWLRAQADEEIGHANRFIDHLIDRDNHPLIGSTSPMLPAIHTPLDAFKAAFAHEQKVSESIRNLYRKAEQDGDIDSRPLLHAFVSEQVEEEATISEIVDRLTLVGDDGSGVLRLDAELGARTASAGQ